MAWLNSISEFSRSSRRASIFKDPLPALRETTSQNDQHQTAEPSNTQDESSSALEPSEQDRHSTTDQDERTPLLDSHDTRSNDEEAGDPLLRSKLQKEAYDRVEQMNRQREECRAKQNEDEREPLLIEKIRRSDGTQAEVIIGQSTLPQTVFNSSNGVLGFKLR